MVNITSALAAIPFLAAMALPVQQDAPQDAFEACEAVYASGVDLESLRTPTRHVVSRELLERWSVLSSINDCYYSKVENLVRNFRYMEAPSEGQREIVDDYQAILSVLIREARTYNTLGNRSRYNLRTGGTTHRVRIDPDYAPSVEELEQTAIAIHVVSRISRKYSPYRMRPEDFISTISQESAVTPQILGTAGECGMYQQKPQYAPFLNAYRGVPHDLNNISSRTESCRLLLKPRVATLQYLFGMEIYYNYSRSSHYCRGEVGCVYFHYNRGADTACEGRSDGWRDRCISSGRTYMRSSLQRRYRITQSLDAAYLAMRRERVAAEYLAGFYVGFPWGQIAQSAGS